MNNEEFFQKTLKEIANRIHLDEPLTSDFSNDDLTLLYSMGHHLYQTAEYGEASKIFQRLVVSKPLNKEYWFAYAGALQMKKDYEEALTGWAMASIIDADDPMPHFHAAECLFSLKVPTEGERALSEVEERLGEEEHPLKEKIKALRKSWYQTHVA